MRETRVQSLDWEDPLEKEMAIHSSTIAWKIPWTKEPGKLHVLHGVAKSRTRLSDFTFTFTLIKRRARTGEHTLIRKLLSRIYVAAFWTKVVAGKLEKESEVTSELQ